eukprot:1457369-Rhodomonas_salina.1
MAALPRLSSGAHAIAPDPRVSPVHCSSSALLDLPSGSGATSGRAWGARAESSLWVWEQRLLGPSSQSERPSHWQRSGVLAEGSPTSSSFLPSLPPPYPLPPPTMLATPATGLPAASRRRSKDTGEGGSDRRAGGQRYRDPRVRVPRYLYPRYLARSSLSSHSR